MQSKLVEILRHKGIGPKGSKQLNAEDISQIPDLLKDLSCQLTTKATLLTALQLLDKSEEEEELLLTLKKDLVNIPTELHFLLNKTSSNYLEETILCLINRHDLTEDDAIKSSDIFLNNQTEAYFQAAYLEALRLKRETDLENKTFYQYFLKESQRVSIDTDPIIEICDSYDGVERNFNFNLYTATVLSCMGYKVLVTGNETVAPKNGITHHQLLKAVNKNPTISLEEAAKQLLEIGVCYVDQSVFHPQMWHKKQMRADMVKRPFLATFEKILSPIHSTKGNYIITSYTHAHYKNANIEIFKSSPYISKALNIKGLEGTIHPKANISVPVLYLHNNQTTETSYVFEGEIKETDFEVTIENNLKFGSEFIELNQDNIAKNYVTNTIIMILRSFELENDSEKIKLKINQIIDNKDVIDKFKKINSVD